jgi:hypothetical protein
LGAKLKFSNFFKGELRPQGVHYLLVQSLLTEGVFRHGEKHRWWSGVEGDREAGVLYSSLSSALLNDEEEWERHQKSWRRSLSAAGDRLFLQKNFVETKMLWVLIKSPQVSQAAEKRLLHFVEEFLPWRVEVVLATEAFFPGGGEVSQGEFYEWPNEQRNAAHLAEFTQKGGVAADLKKVVVEGERQTLINEEERVENALTKGKEEGLENEVKAGVERARWEGELPLANVFLAQVLEKRARRRWESLCRYWQEADLRHKLLEQGLKERKMLRSYVQEYGQDLRSDRRRGMKNAENAYVSCRSYHPCGLWFYPEGAAIMSALPTRLHKENLVSQAYVSECFYGLQRRKLARKMAVFFLVVLSILVSALCLEQSYKKESATQRAYYQQWENNLGHCGNIIRGVKESTAETYHVYREKNALNKAWSDWAYCIDDLLGGVQENKPRLYEVIEDSLAAQVQSIAEQDSLVHKFYASHCLQEFLGKNKNDFFIGQKAYSGLLQFELQDEIKEQRSESVYEEGVHECKNWLRESAPLHLVTERKADGSSVGESELLVKHDSLLLVLWQSIAQKRYKQKESFWKTFPKKDLQNKEAHFWLHFWQENTYAELWSSLVKEKNRKTYLLLTKWLQQKLPPFAIDETSVSAITQAHTTAGINQININSKNDFWLDASFWEDLISQKNLLGKHLYALYHSRKKTVFSVVQEWEYFLWKETLHSWWEQYIEQERKSFMRRIIQAAQKDLRVYPFVNRIEKRTRSRDLILDKWWSYDSDNPGYWLAFWQERMFLKNLLQREGQSFFSNLSSRENYESFSFLQSFLPAWNKEFVQWWASVEKWAQMRQNDLLLEGVHIQIFLEQNEDEVNQLDVLEWSGEEGMQRGVFWQGYWKASMEESLALPSLVGSEQKISLPQNVMFWSEWFSVHKIVAGQKYQKNNQVKGGLHLIKKERDYFSRDTLWISEGMRFVPVYVEARPTYKFREWLLIKPYMWNWELEWLAKSRS